MNRLHSCLVMLLLLVAPSVTVQAQDLVYMPLNPSFGGSPFNAQWLLSEAQAQYSFAREQQEAATQAVKSDPLSDFKQNLDRQILSMLSRQLVTNTFGETSLKDGHYEMGDFVVDVSSTLEGIVINIFDKGTGGETNVIVPYF